MKLLLTTTSPYALKARVLIRERGLQSEVEEVVVSPHLDDPSLVAASAVGKVPALATELGVLIDSRVICEYLDAVAEGTSRLPLGPERWTDLCRVATGDAVMDAATAVVMERRRPEGEQSPAFVERQLGKVRRVVGEVGPGRGGDPTLGDLSVACALCYLDFRLPELSWRALNAELAEWHEQLAARSSFRGCPLG